MRDILHPGVQATRRKKLMPVRPGAGAGEWLAGELGVTRAALNAKQTAARRTLEPVNRQTCFFTK